MIRCLYVFVIMLLLSGIAVAKPADKLHQVEQKLELEKQKQAELDRKAKETGESLRELRQQLIAATAAIEDKSSEEEQLEDKLDSFESAIAAKTEAVKVEKKKLRLLATALLDMARQPMTSLFLRDGMTEDYIHRTIVARDMLPQLRRQVVAMLDDLLTLHTMQNDVEGQRKIVAAARVNLEKQQRDLDQLIKSRQGLLSRTEVEKNAIAAQLASLSSEAKDLRQLLEKITPKRAPKSAPPTAAVSGLKWPVSGNIIRSYGQRDTDGVLSDGITFVALPGAPVVAPRPGKVVFAGPFRGYGQILILQHDGGYHSFMAGLGRIDVDMGQEVETGEPLGVLPTGGSRRPELYFEWRHNNEPVAPR